MDLQKYRKFAECLTDFIFIDDEVKPSDVIFVPGNGFPQMAEAAAGLYARGLSPFILPSGRWAIGSRHFMGPAAKREKYTGPYRTEWEFLLDVLMKNGVPGSAVLREDEARFTYENAINSRKVTDAAGICVKRGILCVNAVHARRCRMYYGLLYPDSEILVHAVPASGITRDNWMLSEAGIEAVTGEVERCGGQFAEILKGLV
ncbi:MAG TPA: YdcF family protein [Lachnospiraceae bacterium]|nr:YdcF family protein [Lachnospiraceae bacterium]